MALQINEVFAKHQVNFWVIIYVKYEGGNISIMIIGLNYVVSCQVLGSVILFIGTFWGM
jgi:hypothetical protein